MWNYALRYRNTFIAAWYILLDLYHKHICRSLKLTLIYIFRDTLTYTLIFSPSHIQNIHTNTHLLAYTVDKINRYWCRRIITHAHTQSHMCAHIHICTHTHTGTFSHTNNTGWHSHNYWDVHTHELLYCYTYTYTTDTTIYFWHVEIITYSGEIVNNIDNTCT